MKKAFAAILIAVMLCLPLAGCGGEKAEILKISNWEDYIDEDMCDDFSAYMAEKGRNVVVEYSTFGTNENLYNDLKIADGYVYDLICPSDYMIEKMAREGMLAEISDLMSGSDYEKYASPYIRDVFDDRITWHDDKKNADKSLGDYAAGYMWGTLGLIFNPDYYGVGAEQVKEDMNSWYSLWSPKYKNKMTLKDSVRDSYIVGIAEALKDEIAALDADAEDYLDKLSAIFNDTAEDTVAKVETALKSLKNNIYGFEVDSGKNDIVTGKITINLAWSGDAVAAMDEAEDVEEGETPVELYYTVPQEGSNIWFDGWCVPEHAKNKDLAVEFINFLSRPENAVRNMEYIGYTSVISGEAEEPFSIEYEDETCEYAGILDWVKQTYDLQDEESEDYPYAVNLGYFFGEEELYVYTDTLGRQFSAQYPDEETQSRCVVMNYFNDEVNARVNKMWENVKGESFPHWTLALIIAAIVMIVAAALMWKFKEKIFKGGGRRRGKRGCRIVAVENIR